MRSDSTSPEHALARAGMQLRDEPAKTRVRIVAPMPYGGEREWPDRERRRVDAQLERFAIGLDQLCRHSDNDVTVCDRRERGQERRQRRDHAPALSLGGERAIDDAD